jgi:DNA-binding beta-propeller fold protein YncE
MNPLQIAILRWYAANLTTQFPVGNGPNAVAFDEERIWVANENDSTVSKLRASDGTLRATFTVAAGLAFDGANICVANIGSGTFSKL